MTCMRLSYLVVCLLFGLSSGIATGNAQEEAIKNERKKFEGTWRVASLEVNGEKSHPEDLKNIRVVNGNDGTWSIRVNGEEVTKGTSQIDPTKKIKTIDFTPTVGDDKGKQFRGIYELGDNTRKLCFATAEKGRPTDFSANPGSDRWLVQFERER